MLNRALTSRRPAKGWGHHSSIGNLKRPPREAPSAEILRNSSRCSRKATYIRKMVPIVFHKMIRRHWRWHWTPRSRFIAQSVNGDKTWCFRARRITKIQLRQAIGGLRHEPSHRWAALKSTSKQELQAFNWNWRVRAPPRQNLNDFGQNIRSRPPSFKRRKSLSNQAKNQSSTEDQTA